MLTLIYWLITAFVLSMVLWNYFKKNKVSEHLNAILIIIPFILRLLLIK